MIPAHKCIQGLCDPDEGIHCLPTFGPENVDIELSKKNFGDFGIELIKWCIEPDLTPETRTRIVTEDVSGQPILTSPNQTVGYLVWLKEKDPNG